ncbi:MAG: sugar transferase [Candidatus Omnitrophica bacterium]|nr:sugar transferase [Candidatus Omnitrophota bacterium]MBU1933610.1 sugar transferase [Candidatus Omnitrophota bacterium]
MIKAKEQLLRKLLMVLDLSVVLVAFLIAFRFRQNIQDFYSLDFFPERHILGELKGSQKYIGILPFFLFAWWAALSSSGLYESFRRKKFFELVWGIAKSGFFVMVVFATAVFIFKLDFVSRSLIISSFFIAGFLLTLERWLIVIVLRFLRKQGYNYRNILVVGTGQRAENFISLVQKHREWGLRIVGLIDAEREMLGRVVRGEKVIGVLEDIPEILTRNVIDEVIFIVPRKWLPFIEKSLLDCEIRGINAHIATDFFNMNIASSTAGDIEGIPLMMFSATVGEEWQLLIKRLFDIIFSLAGIILLFPLFVALTVIIKRVCPGPAIFKQVRSGLNGRKFIMYKFRTMINGADKEKETLNGFNEMDGPVFKMRNDPRVTKFGRFLRRTSLDELPQLFNILKGEMSFVGPRPPVSEEVEKYEIWQRRRLSMKPGLTCLWQANGRNNVDFHKWMKMDLEYIDNWSLSLDLKILLKTIPAVLFSIGAR